MTHHFLGKEAELSLTARGIPVPQPIEIVGMQEKLGIFPRLRRWLGGLTARGFKEGGFLHDYTAPADTIAVPLTTGRGINPKDALGLAKPDMSVVPPSAMLHLASAMMDGAHKYGPFNWRDNAVLGRVYVAAAMRHLLQYLDGEDIDPTSGVHHLGHAMACAAIVLDARETGNLDDNRPHSGRAGEMVRRWTPETKLG